VYVELKAFWLIKEVMCDLSHNIELRSEISCRSILCLSSHAELVLLRKKCVHLFIYVFVCLFISVASLKVVNNGSSS